MSTWAGPPTDEDLDRLTEECQREQRRVVEHEVPEKIATLFADVYGPAWEATHAKEYAVIVGWVRAQMAKVIAAANADFAAARAAGFPERWPVLH